MDDLVFIDSNGRLSVYINNFVYSKLIEACKKSPQKEIGGILIGNYSKDNTTAIVTSLAVPYNSVSESFSFFRGNQGLLKILDEAWEEGKYYIGEWHYHPNSQPMPSSQDKNQMFFLSKYKNLHCPEPILIIIGGNSLKWMINVMVFANDEILYLYLDKSIEEQ